MLKQVQLYSIRACDLCVAGKLSSTLRPPQCREECYAEKSFCW